MASRHEGGPYEYCLNFEETELRLGLPSSRGGGDGNTTPSATKINGAKRGFVETVVLKFNLTTKESVLDPVEKKNSPKEKNLLPCTNDPAKPPTKFSLCLLSPLSLPIA
uniref:Uncharacterized protein n=1 Tax=Nelumbo nucifera TaxID=4432 RepID=A0A822XFQ8_NELNU|nr:TPA_asm: hypothetical protein HUJ06_020683 [Nelumbo nucifera]